MDEPVLTNLQKQELVLMLNELIELTNNSRYSKYFKAFIISVDNQEIGCHMRAKGCFKCMAFNNITDYDCSKCWFNWYVIEHEVGLFPIVTNDDIKNAFGNDLVEIKKRDNYSCYRLLFKAEKEKDKTYLLNCFNGMKVYLEGD